jgi:ABC-type glycerol-3-phosphate transport system permease component
MNLSVPHARWLHLILLPLALIWLLPTLILINGSLRLSTDSIVDLGPSTLTFSNVVAVWRETPLPTLFLNSAVVTVGSVLVVVIVASLAGFGLVHYRFRGSGVVMIMLLSGIMLAPSAIIVPEYELMVRFRLLNTYGALIGPYSALGIAVSILLFRNAFASLPRELAESAQIDGASSFAIYRNIYLPLASTTTVTIVILQGLAAWNDYIFALLFMTDPGKQTVQLAFIAFQGQYFSSLPKQFAVMALVTVPVVVVFIALQRAFVSGLTAGALR